MKCGTPVQEQMAVQQTARKDLQATRSPNHGNNLVGMAYIRELLIIKMVVIIAQDLNRGHRLPMRLIQRIASSMLVFGNGDIL